MIVFALRTWSPNEERGTTKGARMMWAARFKAQREKTTLEIMTRKMTDEVRVATMALADHAQVTVTLKRYAPSDGLDDDNLAKSLKSVRDGVAHAMGVPNDRDPRWEWKYRQTRNNEYAVGIDFDVFVEV